MTTIKAYPDCPSCHGEGTVYDSVEYWGANVSMPSLCETCIERAIAEGVISEEEADGDIEVEPNVDAQQEAFYEQVDYEYDRRMDR